MQVGGPGRIEVDQVKTLFFTGGARRQPAAGLLADHPGPLLAHRCEVGPGHRRDASILFDSNRQCRAPQQGFAGHHAAAAAEVEPAAAG